jgi:MATE family, multidrug efflux pump
VTEQKPPSSLLRLAWPLMISFTARSLLTSIDIPYGSRLGDAAVAAIGLAFPLEFAFIACWVGLSAALTSHLSRAMGERHEERLRQLKRVATHMVLGLMAMFLGLAAGIYLLADHLGLDPEVAAYFRLYAPVLLIGAALSGFWSTVPDSIIKAHHDTKSTMVAGLLSGLLNLSLNTLFLFGFGWGIVGIALATGLGRTGGLLYALYRARRLEDARRVEWAGALPAALEPAGASKPGGSKRLDEQGLFRQPYRVLLVLGVPSSLTFVLMAAEGGIVNGLLSQVPDSTAAIAAYAIYHRAVLLFLMPVVATGVAVLPYVARLVGEGRGREVGAGLRGGFVFASVYAVLFVAPTCFLAADRIAEFLGNSESTQALAGFAIRWATPLGVLVAGPFLLCRPAFEAVQRGGPALVMAVVRYLLLSVPLAWAGMAAASGWGVEPFAGLVGGLILGTGLVSILFTVWLVRMVKTLR